MVFMESPQGMLQFGKNSRGIGWRGDLEPGMNGLRGACVPWVKVITIPIKVAGI